MSTDSDQPHVPYITTDQMREVDRAMVEEYGIALLQMMENAGRNLAHLARRRFLEGDPRGRKVLVLAGNGGNGGGGLVCARRLHSWDAAVEVWTTAQPSQLADVTRHQLTILEQMEVPAQVADEEVELPATDLIVDALIGYSLRGAPQGTTAALIRAANGHGAPILALDVPSGIDSTTGAVHEPAIRAAATLTLALPKQGFRSEAAMERIGELYLGDISVPPGLYGRAPLGLDVGPIFSTEEIVRLW